MTPKSIYQQHLNTQEYQADDQQAAAVDKLEIIYQELMATTKQSKLKRWFSANDTPIQGLYLWGGVGIGKTWLMDMFCEALPNDFYLRIHFHRFMHQIHMELKRLQGEKNPLNLIAKRYASKIKVLCFDEFFVKDITDAMILAGLFQALFHEGITLVTTSNCAPDELYKNGLQRERFIPAIELIKKYTDVMHITTEKDYRLRELHQAGIFHHPINEITREKMRATFETLADKNWKKNELLLIQGRAIETIRLGTSVAWFNFHALCDIPRSQVDYLQIAKMFHTVMLSNVPQISTKQDNLVTYLINLIDIFYDSNVKLIMSSEVSIEEIYPSGRLSFEFRRTLSRLQEMQTLEYLQKGRG